MAIGSPEPALWLAVALCVAALAVAALPGLQLLAMRLRRARQSQARQAIVERWQPLLLQAARSSVDGLPLPALAPSDRIEWLVLWNRQQDGARGAAHAALNQLAERLGLPAAARGLAQGRDLADRVLGVVTLGHLGQAEDAPLLRALLADPHTPLSLAAARALLQVDAAAAVPPVMAQYLRRSDWPAARLGVLLRDLGAPAAATALGAQLLDGSTEVQLRLLPLLRLAQLPQAGDVLHTLVARSSDPQVLSAALRQLHDRAALPRVRELGGHVDALVRSAVAFALGRLGGEGDRAQVVALLSDTDWWVRYRAAQALLALPGHAPAQLDALRATLSDRFARDALDHVRAERAIRAGVAPALADDEAPQRPLAGVLP